MQNQKELLNIDQFGVVDVVNKAQSQQVLSTSWIQKQRLDVSYKMRTVATGIEQLDGQS